MRVQSEINEERERERERESRHTSTARSRQPTSASSKEKEDAKLTVEDVQEVITSLKSTQQAADRAKKMMLTASGQFHDEQEKLAKQKKKGKRRRTQTPRQWHDPAVQNPLLGTTTRC